MKRRVLGFRIVVMLKRVQSHRFPLMLNPPPPATNDNSECIFIVSGDVDLYCHFLVPALVGALASAASLALALRCKASGCVARFRV